MLLFPIGQRSGLHESSRRLDALSDEVHGGLGATLLHTRRLRLNIRDRTLMVFDTLTAHSP